LADAQAIKKSVLDAERWSLVSNSARSCSPAIDLFPDFPVFDDPEVAWQRRARIAPFSH
jgi:hypothetical protein